MLSLSLMLIDLYKMVMNSDADFSASSVLIITTDECGVRQQTTLAAANAMTDEHFDLEYGFGNKKTKKSKSFIRSNVHQSNCKTLNNEHRNKSVPHNLQVTTTTFQKRFFIYTFLLLLLLLVVIVYVMAPNDIVHIFFMSFIFGIFIEACATYYFSDFFTLWEH